MKLKILLWAVILISLSLNFFLLFLLSQKPTPSIPLTSLNTDYPLLASRILIENYHDVLINFIPLRSSLKEIVAPWEDSFSFYFEYLPTGISIGINEKHEYETNSLLKLPFIITLYRQMEETGLDIESTTLKLEEKHIDQEFGTLWQKGPGYEITVKEAVNYAIIDSDNTAIKAIKDLLQPKYLVQVYDNLDVPLTTDKDNNPTISAKNYSSILKSLYFSSILSKENSQKILDLLTMTNYKDKLPSGITDNIKVAHKIGVRRGQIYQDCGIVYLPERPYILCMFSRSDENTARDRMTLVSKTIFNFLNAGKK